MTKMKKTVDVIRRFPQICEDAVKITEELSLPSYIFSKILVCGMGGSAIGGDLLKDLLRNEIQIPIEVSRQYHLPGHADENTLIFCVSYSGDTEETLSQFVDAIVKKCKIIGITSNGRLKEWCERFSLPCVPIPEGYRPRAALPYLFFPMIVCLQKFGLINLEKDIVETIQVLRSVKTKGVKGTVPALKGFIPIIYGFNEFTSVAKRMKTQFNENSKVPAYYGTFPELNHNEIVGFQNEKLGKNSSIIFLRSRDEPEEIRVRIEASEKLVVNGVHEINELWAIGKSKLSKMMSLIFLGDILSYELALLNEADPEETEFISILKKKLRSKIDLPRKLEKRLCAFPVGATH